MNTIETQNLGYRITQGKDRKTILDHFSICIGQGQFVAVIGRNGSGKTTFAKHLNALLKPTEGIVYLNGMDTSCEEKLWNIRRQCGMVFQNPEDQFVGMTVEEDVAFGPENYGIPSGQIREEVDAALQKTGLTALAGVSLQALSGGEKQRTAIASVLVMKPDCLVLDESTSMLDPQSRKEIFKVLKELQEKERMTILLITHCLQETLEADKIFVIDQGQIVLSGSPREILSQDEALIRHGIVIPPVIALSHRLYDAGKISRRDILFSEELKEQYKRDKTGKTTGTKKNDRITRIEERLLDGYTEEKSDKTELLHLENVSYTYPEKTVTRKKALSQVKLHLYQGEWMGIVGKTGSGKSTLLQVMSGLLRPTEGEAAFKKLNGNKRSLWTGLVFQFPERQLFATTVLEDVMYGALNKGLDREKAEQVARNALYSLGVKENVYEDSPFCLSAGEQRRVAIAGILAMEPELLLVDEPTAGLDPAGQIEMLEMLRRLQREEGKTIVMVSHDMEQVAAFADRVVLMEEGKILLDRPVRKFFRENKLLLKCGLDVPEVTKLCEELFLNEQLSDRSITSELSSETVLTVEEAMEIL